MRDYDSVVKSLRCCVSDSEPCEHCNCELEECNPKTIMDIAADAIEELLAKVPNWISVEDRLPKPGERVLITNGSFVCESYQSQGKRWMRHGCYMDYMQPTHWMSLPTPPKEVTGDA